MLLVVVMPSVSRVMPVAHAMPTAMAGMARHCVHHAMPGQAPSAPDEHEHGHGLDHCGYCVLLNHQSLLASGKIAHGVPMAPPTNPVFLAPVVAGPTPVLLVAQPRGPPLIG